MRYRPISRNNDFARVYRRGKSQVHALVVVYWSRNRAGHTRVGISASKKVGNAVQRNRARRVIRHALYAVLPENIGPYDLVFVARGKTPYAKSTRLVPVLRAILTAEGLLPGKNAASAPPLQAQAPRIQTHNSPGEKRKR